MEAEAESATPSARGSKDQRTRVRRLVHIRVHIYLAPHRISPAPSPHILLHSTSPLQCAQLSPSPTSSLPPCLLQPLQPSYSLHPLSSTSYFCPTSHTPSPSHSPHPPHSLHTASSHSPTPILLLPPLPGAVERVSQPSPRIDETQPALMGHRRARLRPMPAAAAPPPTGGHQPKPRGELYAEHRWE